MTFCYAWSSHLNMHYVFFQSATCLETQKIEIKINGTLKESSTYILVKWWMKVPPYHLWLSRKGIIPEIIKNYGQTNYCHIWTILSVTDFTHHSHTQYYDCGLLECDTVPPCTCAFLQYRELLIRFITSYITGQESSFLVMLFRRPGTRVWSAVTVSSAVLSKFWSNVFHLICSYVILWWQILCVLEAIFIWAFVLTQS
jgi:hypothetical protein